MPKPHGYLAARLLNGACHHSLEADYAHTTAGAGKVNVQQQARADPKRLGEGKSRPRDPDVLKFPRLGPRAPSSTQYRKRRRALDPKPPGTSPVAITHRVHKRLPELAGASVATLGPFVSFHQLGARPERTNCGWQPSVP